MATDFAPMQVNELICRGTHTDPRLNNRVDHGCLTQNPGWPHGITLIVCDMPTEFAPMQVNDTHIPWNTHRSPFQRPSQPGQPRPMIFKE